MAPGAVRCAVWCVQVKGLQTAYAQATADDKKDSAGGEGAPEVAALKKQVWWP